MSSSLLRSLFSSFHSSSSSSSSVSLIPRRQLRFRNSYLSPSPAMGKQFHEGKGSFDNETREGLCKGACDIGASSDRIADHIMPHILNLYGSCATPDDFTIYAPNATFEDPLMCAHGITQIKSAFYSLSKVFSESKIVEYSIEQHVISPGKQEILIDNKQHYKIMGKAIDMISLIKLHVEGGKVVSHEDWWDKKPLSNRDTVKLPLAGRAMELVRRGSMLTTHVLMRFGKDPAMVQREERIETLAGCIAIGSVDLNNLSDCRLVFDPLPDVNNSRRLRSWIAYELCLPHINGVVFLHRGISQDKRSRFPRYSEKETTYRFDHLKKEKGI